MLGTYARAIGYYEADYLKAQQARKLIIQDFDRIFQEVDALVTPTSPVTAFKIGEKVGDPVQMYLIDVCTLPVNIAGLPGLSVPFGFSEGLPVGMQVSGPHFPEEPLLRTAPAYEAGARGSGDRPGL